MTPFFSSDDVFTSVEESELGICCSEINMIRQILYKAKKMQGLIYYDVEKLKTLINKHDFENDCSNLQKILDAFDIEIKGE